MPPSDTETWHSAVFTWAGKSCNLEDVGGSHLDCEEDRAWDDQVPVNYSPGWWHGERIEPIPDWREALGEASTAAEDEALSAPNALEATTTAQEASNEVSHSDEGDDDGEVEAWRLQWLLERLEVDGAASGEMEEAEDIIEGSDVEGEDEIEEDGETEGDGNAEHSEPPHDTPYSFGMPIESNDSEELRDLLAQHDTALGRDHCSLDPAMRRVP